MSLKCGEACAGRLVPAGDVFLFMCGPCRTTEEVPSARRPVCDECAAPNMCRMAGVCGLSLPPAKEAKDG